MSSKAAEKVVFCQIDAHLDTNPKIRRAGRDGRDVFEFVLRRVAIGRTNGTVPLKYIEPWYLADQLMMTEEEARHGTSQAVTVRLIDIDTTAGVCRVLGWSEEWGRKPLSGSERTKRWRDKQANSNTPVTDCDGVPSQVTVGNESDVREEKRGEEKKSPDQRDIALATILILEILRNNPGHRLGRLSDSDKAKKLEQWARHVRLMREVDGHSETEIRECIRWCQADPFWRSNILSTEKLREKWDTLVLQMRRNSPSAPAKPPKQQTITLDYGDGEREVEVT